MKKIELHWQIFIAIVIGVLYGVIFSPTIKITENSIRNIESQNISEPLIEELKNQKEMVFKTQRAMNDELVGIITNYYASFLVPDKMIEADAKGRWMLREEYLQSIKNKPVPSDLKQKIIKISEIPFESEEKGQDGVYVIIREKAAKISRKIIRNAEISTFGGYKRWRLIDWTFEQIENSNIPLSVINQISKLEGKKFSSNTQLEKQLKKTIGKKNTEKYGEVIMQQAEITNHISYVSWMGDLFMRGLRMVIIPLILTSIISGVANIGNAENLGRLGLKTLGYYVSTSTLAIVTGLFFVNLIKPGVGADLGFSKSVDGLDVAQKSFGDTLMHIVPTNIFEALSASETLAVIFFAILFGFFITRVNRKSSIFLTDFFNSAFDVMMKITMFVIRFTPFGIVGIVASVVAEQASDFEKLAELGARLGWYMIAVLSGLFVHAVVVLPLLLRFLGKANPWLHFKVMRSALLTAFSTSSSGATLSLTMESVEGKAGVSTKITSFTLPLGATINMDGTALYECVAAMFIAQAYGFDLTFAQQVIVVMTALLASIGAASIPMAGLVMITVVLTAIGLPLEGVGLILAVDRILDMFRTATNVWSDSCGAVVIAKSEGEELLV